MSKYFITIYVFLWTAFSLGFELKDLQKACADKTEVDINFFAPDQAKAFKEQLLWMFDNAHGGIKAAFYRLTDRDISQALIAAHNRNVNVQVVVDSGAINTRYSLIKSLYQAGIEVFCYQATGLLPPFPRTFPSIMHHKFILFQDVHGNSLVACGSLNYTNAGFNGNQEQMQIRTNHKDSFLKHFDVLKERSYKVDKEVFSKAVAKKSKRKVHFLGMILRSLKMIR